MNRETNGFSLNAAVQRAARDLPAGFQIHVHLEKGAGWVTLDYPGTPFVYSPDGGGMTLSEQIDDCILKAETTHRVNR